MKYVHGGSTARNIFLSIIAVFLISGSIIIPASFNQSAMAANTLTVSAKDSSGTVLHMWIVIKNGSGSIVKTGFTPLVFAGNTGSTYTVTPSDYGSNIFNHWGNGSTQRVRTYVAGTSNAWFDAYYGSGSTSPTPTPDPTPIPATGISAIIPKTGVIIALYSYPNSLWQKVYDEKVAHPNVPIVVTFNPSTGPGSNYDGNFASWVSKLQSVGVIMIGYTYDNYASRSLSAINADIDKYVNWYHTDGLFLDEVTNQSWAASHYAAVDDYAKSKGMKITVGNPGTDIPPSFIGTLDVFNTSEGPGSISITDPNLIGSGWTGGHSGWHTTVDKRNFSYIRYALGSLDTNFELASSQYVGLLYLHSGTDSTGRWFSLAPYLDQEIAILDR